LETNTSAIIQKKKVHPSMAFSGSPAAPECNKNVTGHHWKLAGCIAKPSTRSLKETLEWESRAKWASKGTNTWVRSIKEFARWKKSASVAHATRLVGAINA